jgi:hypothetical protein
MDRKIATLSMLLLVGLLLAACNLPGFSQPATPDIGAIHTAAAQTLAVQLTRVAEGEPVNTAPTQTPPPAESTATVAPPTRVVDTPLPTATYTPIPTQIILPSATPTLAPTSTNTPVPSPTFTPTATPVPCLLGTFIKDVTIPDGSKMQPGWDISKTWRVRNDGSCTWTRDFTLVFVSGDQMSGRTTSLPQEVKPGQMVDITLDLVAPSYAGKYRGNWMLQSANGKRFGVGRNGDVPLYASIEVVAVSDGTAFNFATMYCTAKWESAVEKELDCPGKVTDKFGFVYRLEYPRLETKLEDKAALWMQPDAGFNGWITGTYPKYKVATGDHFKAWVGCLENSPKCDVTFQLHYRSSGPALIELGSWQEEYDGKITEIDIDLSSYSGQEVEFVLTVLSNGDSADDTAFWMFPRIVR